MNKERSKYQKTIRNRLGIWAVIGLVILAIFVGMAMPAQAATTLRITDNNLDILQNKASWTAYSYGELMLWPSSLDVKYQYKKMLGEIQATTVNDNKNSPGLLGQCVSLAKALSNSYVITDNWIKGDNVMSAYNMVAPGTVIATFDSNGKYSPGHTAIFRNYLYDSNGKKIGILVWDQNYLPSLYGIVARHKISSKGATYLLDPNNADNHYTVKV